jgi:hypothetical protein
MALARKKTILNNPFFKRQVNICFTPPICFTTSLPKGKPDGIPIRGVNIRHYNNLDRQSAYIAAFYELSETLGFYCHHSTFIGMMIDSRYACRKGAVKGPHCILFGGPESGKSHVMLMAKECLQSPENTCFGRLVTYMVCFIYTNGNRSNW